MALFPFWPRRTRFFVAAFTGSHRYILGYLTDEVLLQQPESVRTFLLRTAILDRLTGPLCDAVTGRDDSQEILEQLEAANLFIVPLDDKRRWYRYHHLFADFLRTELDGESQAAFHLKAARWLAAHDLLPEAVRHTLASGDMNEAAGVIALAAEGALRTASFTTLLSWLNALPDDLVRANYELATYRGFLLNLTRKFAEAAAYADDAERSLPPDAPPPSRGRLLSLKAQVALCHGTLDSAVRLSKEALNYLGDGDTFFRSQTLNVMGQVLQMQGDIAAAADVYRDGVLTGRQAGDQQDVMHVLLNLVFALNELGQRSEALAVCQQAIEHSAAQPGRASPWVEIVYLVLGLLSYEANELALAGEQILRALDVCRQMHFNDGILLGPYFLAQVHLASGEIGAMLEVIRKVRQFAARSDLDMPYEPLFAALEAQASLQQGDLAAAMRWAEAVKLTPADTPHPFMEPVYFVYVRTLLAQDQLEDARTLLATIERSAQQGGRRRKLVTVYLEQALVQQASGHKEQALARVESALRLAAPEDYRRAFLDEGRAIVDLIPRLRHIAPDFVDQVLNTAGVAPVIPRVQALVEPLSEREIEVLQLIAEGLTNREVVQRLFITPGTVKVHTSNIYGKLGVHSRTQAVAQARALGIL